MKKPLLLIATHLLCIAGGFAAGMFTLPILTAPEAPSAAAVSQVEARAMYTGEFTRDLAGSDFLHWGEGVLSVARDSISLQGRISPGPDYRLYLSPEFVETEAEFDAIRAQMVQVGGVDTFENFIVPVPADIDPANYTTAVVWCESFGEFITAARYR